MTVDPKAEQEREAALLMDIDTSPDDFNISNEDVHWLMDRLVKSARRR